MTPTSDLSSRPRLNHSVNQTPLRINGRRYAHGLGVNVWSDIRYYLGGRCSRFTVGVNDRVPTSKDQLPGYRTCQRPNGRSRALQPVHGLEHAAGSPRPADGRGDRLRLQVDATRGWIWDDATDSGRTPTSSARERSPPSPTAVL